VDLISRDYPSVTELEKLRQPALKSREVNQAQSTRHPEKDYEKSIVKQEGASEAAAAALPLFMLTRSALMEKLPFESRQTANNLFKNWANCKLFQVPEKLVQKVIASAHERLILIISFYGR